MNNDSKGTGFDPAALDELLHNPIRLAIITALSQVDTGDFSWLKEITKTTDGNLATHLRKLEDAGYIIVTKTFLGRKPASFYAVTQQGRDRLARYMETLSAIVERYSAGNQ